MLEEILKKFSNYNIEPVDIGIINNVVKLKDRQTNEVKMILKIYRDVGHFTKNKRFLKEIEGYKKASELGIPIPKIFEANENFFYILMENLEGPTLKEVLINESVCQSLKYKLIDQLIYFLMKIKSAKIQKKEDDMNSYLSSFFLRIENSISKIKDKNLQDFVSNKFSLIYQKFLQLQYRFKEDSFSFLHGDPNFSNIIIDKNLKEIKGIVDWEKSHYGHELEDLAKIADYLYFSDNILKNYYKSFPIDEEKLLFFKYLFSLSYIVFFYIYFDEYNFKGNSKKSHEQLLIKKINLLQNFQL